MRNRLIWLPVVGLVGLALWLAFELRPASQAVTAKPAASASRNVLAGTDPREDDLAPLERMGWTDVAPTLDAIGRDAQSRNRVITDTAGSAKTPVRYLRGLLLLAKGETAGATKAFAAIPAADIPPEYLYAPYRLCEGAVGGRENPFRDAMRRAVAAGQTSALVAARVAGHEGDLAGALRACLRTDPAQWTTQDLTWLDALRHHSGLAAETTVMVKAALRSGRVREPLRKPLIALVSLEGERLASAQFGARLVALTRGDAALRQPVVAAVEKQLQLRDRFLRHEYAGLIEAHRAADVRNLPDETLLLLTLASARQSAPVEFGRWSSELRRRFPDPTVASWLQTLLAPPSH